MTVYFLYTVTISQVSLAEPEVVCAHCENCLKFFFIWYLLNNVPFA